ncbi:hypothetical protein AND_005550 [Anopheles darlingi]|uniref:Uncharacterized protein n=1 Tax=Anopheles darlingi TaxID=43151 RepID=W5JHI8_ANODA|nr:hypothetical protein AND_005550 [Anopheles darlingi]
MAMRWESSTPVQGKRRSAKGAWTSRDSREVEEHEIDSLLMNESTIVAADGDHSRSRNVPRGTVQQQRDAEWSSSSTGPEARCPVAVVDVELTDPELEPDGADDGDDQDSSSGIVVLDEASERLLGKWNGSPKGMSTFGGMFYSHSSAPVPRVGRNNRGIPRVFATEQERDGCELRVNCVD